MKEKDLLVNQKSKCRVCNSELINILDFGSQPLGNGFLKKSQIVNEYFYPMGIGFSEESKMVQLIKQPDPKLMFHEEYAFFSSSSKFMSEHFRKFSEFLKNSNYLKSESPFVVELGCNDGILLKNFKSDGMRHLGIEPSKNVSIEANKKGINTICDFFSEQLADQIVKENGKADAILAANVLCHIPDINNLVKGMKKLIKNTGVIIFEDPYLGDIVKKISYDQIYDEHVFLFSALSVSYLFNSHDIELIDLYPQQTHGGSMRYVLAKKGSYKPSERVKEIIKTEKLLGLDDVDKLKKFANKVKKSKDDLISLLKRLKNEGKTIAGYAATSKSTTIFNYCNIDKNLIDYICDTTPIKQGKLSPGMHIPIVSPEEFKKNPPDYAFLLAWNHADEILSKEKDFIKSGGRWITHVPEVKIL